MTVIKAAQALNRKGSHKREWRVKNPLRLRQETQLAVTKAKSSLLKYYKSRLYYYRAV